MKLNEASTYSVELYNLMITEPTITIKSNNITLDSVTIKDNKNTTISFGSTLIMQIDLNTLLSTGKTIIIQEEGITKLDGSISLIYNNLYYDVYSYMEDNNKDIAVFVYHPSGKILHVYVGKKASYYIPLELSKTTEITIDEKKLYLHRCIFEVIPISLLKNCIKNDK